MLFRSPYPMGESCRPIRSAGSQLLADPRVKSKHSEAAFCFFAAKALKELPADLRQYRLPSNMS